MAGGSVSECKEYLFKVLVIGELGVGKTSIIKRYVHQLFSQHYRATIGVDFALKVINWDSKTLVRLQLWDIAGQERFGNMTRVYYKEAVGAFVVFDVTRGSTFEAVSKWKHDLDSKVKLANGSPIPSVLLANKCDQKNETSNNTSLMDNFCKETGFLGWFETSAKCRVRTELGEFTVIHALTGSIQGHIATTSGDTLAALFFHSHTSLDPCFIQYNVFSTIAVVAKKTCSPFCPMMPGT
uniref:Ras-related protein Rab n=1 Tax=Salmo trutta TaxID=8032 RepID=A0A673YDC3_SALTR